MGILTVRTDGEDDVVAEGSAPGQFTSLNLDRDTSTIFVGGAPSSVALPSAVLFLKFISSTNCAVVSFKFVFFCCSFKLNEYK